MPEAARLANEAAGIVVGKFGAATVTPAESSAVLMDCQALIGRRCVRNLISAVPKTPTISSLLSRRPVNVVPRNGGNRPRCWTRPP